MSLPIRGAWIEITRTTGRRTRNPSRSPSGERGLKLHDRDMNAALNMSLPIRGAWIEMPTWDASPTSTRSLPIRGAWIEINRDATSPHGRPCRSPSGERGLKLRVNVRQRRRVCRSPSGERGLKFVKQGLQNHTRMSLPIRGAWIEIFHLIGTTLPILSLPIRGAWIEIGTAS